MFNHFKRRATGPRLLPDQTRREGRVIQLTLAALGDAPSVMLFLNTHHRGLGGRPIDLAIASDEGLLAVERVLSIPGPC